MDQYQYIREAKLFIFTNSGTTQDEVVAQRRLNADDKTMDLSQLRFKFHVSQADTESPNNAAIRVYNLSKETTDLVQKEFTGVVLQAGYEGAGAGVIFRGDIKQFRKGRESPTESYLDILAADGDLGYNFGVVNQTLAPQDASPVNIMKAASDAMNLGRESNESALTGGTLPRGKVLFGLARVVFSNLAATQGATWSIQDGKIQILPLTGYKAGEAVVLNSRTGMVGIPEQTDEGIRVRCLLNPRIVVGGLIKINEDEINKTIQQDPSLGVYLPFDQWAGIQLLASIAADGLYRVYVAEHSGDTRGTEWYTDIIGLAVNSGIVSAY